MLKLKRERFAPKLMGEMVPLVIRHFQELATFKEFRVEPDFDHYVALDKANVLRIYTARDAGKLVGYSVFILLRHPHFKSMTHANEELLFLAPEYRKGTLGNKLITFCDKQLYKDGAQVIYHTVSVERDYSILLLRKGYRLCDRVYARRMN